MIHSAETEVLAVQGVSKLMSESLADSITIGDMRIDDKGNIQYKDNDGSWITVMSPSETLTVNSTTHKYIDIEALKAYDKQIKKYIDARINEKLNSFDEPHNEYKIIMGEDI